MLHDARRLVVCQRLQLRILRERDRRRMGALACRIAEGPMPWEGK